MMPRIITKLRIDEISSVDRGAGEGVRIVLMKRDPPGGMLLFNDIKRKMDPREEPDDKVGSKLKMMVDAMIVADPTLDRQTATHFLLHSPHGRRLYEHLSKGETKMPQVDILNLFQSPRKA